MTTIAAPIPYTSRSGGAGSTVGLIEEKVGQYLRVLRESYVYGQTEQTSPSKAYEIFDECRQGNWDGQGAAPVSERVFTNLYNLLGTLPFSMSPTSLGAEPDGHMTVEWYRSPSRTLSVSVGPDDKLHYAALVGMSEHYGTEPFYMNDELPKRIADLIRSVLAT